MRHKLGVRAHDFGRKSMEDMADCLEKYGFMSPQLVLPKAFAEVEDFDRIGEDTIKAIGRRFRKFDISVLGSYQDLSNENDEIRQKAVDRVCSMLYAAKQLGAHCVGSETSREVFRTREEKEIHMPFMMDSIKRIVSEAVKADMIFAVEPVNIHPLDSVETVGRVFEEIGDNRHLRMIFDPSNLLTDGMMGEQKPFFEKWLKETGPYIDVIHLKDILWDEKGQRIQTPLGEGGIDYSCLNQWLKQADRSVYLVREWLDPACAEKDLLFMKRLGA